MSLFFGNKSNARYLTYYGVTFEDNDDENTIKFPFPCTKNDKVNKILEVAQDGNSFITLPPITESNLFSKLLTVLRLHSALSAIGTNDFNVQLLTIIGS